MKRRILIAGLVALAAAPALAQGKKSATGADDPGVASAAMVAGTYAAKGMNADGSKYDGRVTISQDGDFVSFEWVIGNDIYQGTGQVTGQVVEVDWGEDTPVIYVARPDGELHGTWGGGTALERLIPN